MKVPGAAWLELGCEPGPHGSTYPQCAVFFPRELAGRPYWLAVLLFRGFTFRGLANRITAAAEAAARDGVPACADSRRSAHPPLPIRRRMVGDTDGGSPLNNHGRHWSPPRREA